MADTPQSRSLFDAREVWEAEPLEALVGLLKSTDYLQTGKPRAYPGSTEQAVEEPQVPKLGDGSITVYKSMLGKFLAFMVAQGCPSLFAVSDREIAAFFQGALADAKKETVNRYRRLLERVFDYMVSREFIQANPVTEWLRGFKERHENKKPEDIIPASAPDVVDQETVHRLRIWLKDIGESAHESGDWRTMRNVVAAMLGVGAGLRAKELQVLARKQFTIRPDAAAGEKVEIAVTVGATVKTAQAHRVMADSLCEDLLLEWLRLRFRTGIKPTPNAAVIVPPGERVFVGVGREQGMKATPTSATAKRDPGATNELSVSYFNRALKQLAERAIAEGIIDGDSEKWLLCRGAQGLRRAYTLVEIQGKAEPKDLRLKLGLHLEESVRRIRHQLKAPVPAPRIKA